MSEAARIKTLEETGQISTFEAARRRGDAPKPLGEIAAQTTVHVRSLREYYRIDQKPRRESQLGDWAMEEQARLREPYVQPTPEQVAAAAQDKLRREQEHREKLVRKLAEANPEQQVKILADEHSRYARAGREYTKDTYVEIMHDLELYQANNA